MKSRTKSVITGILLTIVLLGGAVVARGQDGVVGPNPDNGHYYEKIDSLFISWADANAEANDRSRNGCQGYLATITSAQENEFVSLGFGADQLWGLWLGGFQEPGVVPADYGWQWVTGEPWVYTNWAPSEPNDWVPPDEPNDDGALATEQHLEFRWGTPFATWNDQGYPELFVNGYIVEFDAGMCVRIDIKPGSDPNAINLGSKGSVPVAVLTTDTFDASVVDPATVLFAGASPLRWVMEDVDSDGDLDLLFHFKAQELGLNGSSTEATLTGETLDGTTIEGTDTVNIVP